MNFTENKKNGQYYRVLKDTSSDGTRNYDRYSFVTDASDVIFSDGTNVEAKLGGSSGSIAEINREIAELKKSVSDGKRTVATAITDKGVTTATDASFKVMSTPEAPTTRAGIMPAIVRGRPTTRLSL